MAIEDAAYDLIRSAQTRPVLFDYCGDGTPLKLKSAFQVSFAEHHKHARSGYTGEELYCQGGFVRTFDEKGDPVVRCLLRDPIPMGSKSALCSFKACIVFVVQHWKRSRRSSETNGLRVINCTKNLCSASSKSGAQVWRQPNSAQLEV